MTEKTDISDKKNQMLAEYAANPNKSSAVTLTKYNNSSLQADLYHLTRQLDKVTKPVKDGDLSDLSVMLSSQAIALNEIFHYLAHLAITSSYNGKFQTKYLDKALLAQRGSRATVTAIADLNKPSRQYIGQQNVADQQIVSNGQITQDKKPKKD